MSKIHSLITISSTGVLLFAEHLSMDPDLNTEDLLPPEIRKEIINQAKRLPLEELKFQHTFAPFGNKRSLDIYVKKARANGFEISVKEI